MSSSTDEDVSLLENSPFSFNIPRHHPQTCADSLRLKAIRCNGAVKCVQTPPCLVHFEQAQAQFAQASAPMPAITEGSSQPQPIPAEMPASSEYHTLYSKGWDDRGRVLSVYDSSVCN